jgi:DNA (cytosine-5)-methyltransferase 1
LNKQREGDARRALWQPYMDVVEQSGASMFVIENVAELSRSPEMDEILDRATAAKFNAVVQVLNSADYGAPQVRNRTVLIGWKRGMKAPAFPPLQTHASPKAGKNLPHWLTVKDAIGNLRDPVGTEIRNAKAPLDLHFGRNPTDLSRKRYKLVPPGGNRFDLQRAAPKLTPKCWIKKTSGGTDLFGRLWWDRPSVTIRTEFFKPEKGRYLHPESDRPITHREAARLMGFPDWFKFKGTKVQIARQIGNAVPPPLASAIASVVKDCLSGRNKKAKAA